MAIKAEIEALSTTAELVYTANNGSADAPQSIVIYNADASIVVYVGGEGVDTTDGFPLAAGASVSIDLMAGDEVWAVAASGSPNINMLFNRV
jgi:hypothetical protein